MSGIYEALPTDKLPAGWRNLPGVWPRVIRRLPYGSLWYATACPLCRTSKRSRMARQLRGVRLPCYWTPGQSGKPGYVRARYGCTRCKVTFAVYNYAKFNLWFHASHARPNR